MHSAVVRLSGSSSGKKAREARVDRREDEEDERGDDERGDKAVPTRMLIELL